MYFTLSKIDKVFIVVLVFDTDFTQCSPPNNEMQWVWIALDKMSFCAPCDIVHHKGTSSTSVVTSCYSSVKFKKKSGEYLDPGKAI